MSFFYCRISKKSRQSIKETILGVLRSKIENINLDSFSSETVFTANVPKYAQEQENLIKQHSPNTFQVQSQISVSGCSLRFPPFWSEYFCGKVQFGNRNISHKFFEFSVLMKSSKRGPLQRQYCPDYTVPNSPFLFSHANYQKTTFCQNHYCFRN